jgi:ATP-binding cassette, subfamily B, bacterial PglK
MLQKIYQIIEERDRKTLIWILILFIFSSIIDVIGLGLIGPYISLISSQTIIEYTWLKPIIIYLNLPNNFNELLFVISLAVVIIFFLKLIFSIAIQKTILKFGYNQMAQLRSKLMHTYQTLDYIDYTNRNSSEYIYIIENLASIFTGKILIAGLKVVSDIIMGVAILLFLAWKDIIVLSTLVIILGSIVFLYDYLIKVKVSQFGEKANIAGSKMVQGVIEGIEGLKEIRILGKESYFYSAVNKNAKEYSNYLTHSGLYNAIPRYLIEFAMIAFVVLVSIFYLSFGIKSMDLVPTLGVFGVAAMRLIPSFSSLSNGLTQIRFNKNTVSLIHKDIFLERKNNKHSLRRDVSSDSYKTIIMSKIKFQYLGTHTLVLDDIDIEIKTGESIGIVGSSGSGKSSFIDVLLGLLTPTKGEVIYNGESIKENAWKWQQKVAYLPQKVFLIDDSVKKNIALGVENDDINKDKLISSIQNARLVDVIGNLPQGIETNIGEGGIRLSGGQRQRIALARAFYHDREVLIMDESTSALDNETEREIIEEIRYLKGRITIIVVAHRLTTLKHCDYIYEIEKGKIINKHTYEELIESSS